MQYNMLRKETPGKLNSDWLNRIGTPTIDSIKVTAEELRGSLLLRICSFLSLLTALVGLLQICLHVYILCNSIGRITIPLLVAHTYCISFGVIIVSIEYELAVALQYFAFCESWIGRGFFLFFNGIMLHILMQNNTSSVSLYSFCYMMVVTLCSFGAGYVALGLLCFRQLKLREINAIKKKKLVQVQAEQLSKHKTEIEKLLAETQSKIKSEV